MRAVVIHARGCTNAPKKREAQNGGQCIWAFAWPFPSPSFSSSSSSSNSLNWKEENEDYCPKRLPIRQNTFLSLAILSPVVAPASYFTNPGSQVVRIGM